MDTGLHHAGLIFVRQRTPIGAEIRALTKLVTTLTPVEMQDRVEYLGNWVE